MKTTIINIIYFLLITSCGFSQNSVYNNSIRFQKKILSTQIEKDNDFNSIFHNTQYSNLNSNSKFSINRYLNTMYLDSNTSTNKDSISKIEKSLMKDFSIFLSGGITFSGGLDNSINDELISRGYSTSGTLLSYNLELGLQLRIISKLYVYPKFRLSLSKVTFEHSGSFPNSEKVNVMSSPAIDLRIYFLEINNYNLALSGGVNFNTFTPYSDSFKSEPNGAGYSFSIVVIAPVPNNIGAGFELGYSYNPFKTPIYSSSNSYYPLNSNENITPNSNFGGVFLNGLFLFSIADYF